jgi:rod shape-determining protein MreD
MPVTTQFARPVSFIRIMVSLLLALLLNSMPWHIRIWNLQPDFVALLLFYWGMNQPSKVGFFITFIMGILVDVAIGNALGIHSFTYALAMFVILNYRRQFEMYPFWQQAIVIFILMLMIQVIVLVFHLIFLKGTFQHWAYFLSSVTTALLWVPLSNIMWFLQRRSKSSSL